MHVNSKLALIADGSTQVDEELDAVSFSNKNDMLAGWNLDGDIADEELDDAVFDLYSAESMLDESYSIKLKP